MNPIGVSRGETNPRLHPFEPFSRAMRLHATWMEKRFDSCGPPVIDLLSTIRLIARNPTVPALITIEGFI